MTTVDDMKNTGIGRGVGSDYATVDNIREMIEMMVLLQKQIDNLQKQIEILTAKSIEEVNAIVGKRVASAKNRAKEDLGLDGLHKMALGSEIPGHHESEEEIKNREAREGNI